MSQKILESKEIIVYTTLVLVSSSLICYAAHLVEDNNLSILNVLMPSLLAFIYTMFKSGRKGLHDLFIKQTIKKTKLKWFVLSMTGIPLLGFLAVQTIRGFDMEDLGLRTTQLMPQIIVIIMIAIGEEYGWRGFLLPRLMKKFSLFQSSLLLGLIWGVWHFPAYLIGTGTPLDMSFLVFMLWVILGTFFISWIYYYTGSVLTSILVHISANATFNYLLLLPEFTGDMNTFWLFLSYVFVIVLVVFYLKRRDLIEKKPASQ